MNRNNHKGEESDTPFALQREVTSNYFLTASEAERRALIEEQYPGFADFINRRNSLIEMQSVDTSQSDEHPDSETQYEPRVDAQQSASVDELATMFGNKNFNTSSILQNADVTHAAEEAENMQQCHDNSALCKYYVAKSRPPRDKPPWHVMA